MNITSYNSDRSIGEWYKKHYKMHSMHLTEEIRELTEEKNQQHKKYLTNNTEANLVK